MNIPRRVGALDTHLPVADGIRADLIEASALHYEFGRLLNAHPTTNYVETFQTSYDRLLAGALRLAFFTAFCLDKYLDGFEDGVFTYECIELPQRLPPNHSDDTLTMAVWGRMTPTDWYQIAENFEAPAWLEEAVRNWLLATPEKFALKPEVHHG